MAELDLMTCREMILDMINSISTETSRIYELATEKADAISQYDLKLAIQILKLANGLVTEFEGLKIDKLTAGDRVIIAKGMIYQASMDKEAAEGLYKSCLSNIEAKKAQLNGIQSINKHLE